MPTIPNATDKGVVFYATKNGGDSYVDGKGNPRQAQQLSNSTWLTSDTFMVGLSVDMLAMLSGALTGHNALVRLEVQRRDVHNPNLFHWASIAIGRGDQPGGGQVELSIAPGDLIRAFDDNAPQDVAIMSTDHRLSNRARFIVKLDGAPANGDAIAVGLGA